MDKLDGTVGKESPSMIHSQRISIFSRGRATLLSVAVLSLLATSGRSPAQDAGVSGIPPGPANARGLNGSVNDPSGIGNAAKVPSLPQPNLNPVPVPSLSSPVVTRTGPVPATVKIRRTRVATSRSGRAAARAAVRAQDKRIDHEVSICRGC
jgi:hypothetical protein